MKHQIAVLSDPHLSREYPFFLHNWNALVAKIREMAPELVIVNGDLALGEPDRKDDLVFAQECIEALDLPVVVLPGNHDIGEGDGLGQQKGVTSQRLAQYNELFGPDHWIKDVGEWTLIGINSQILGTGLSEEAEHRRFIETALADYRDRHLAIVSHKPLYDGAQGTAVPGRGIEEDASNWLSQIFTDAGVRFILAGHMHRFKNYMAGNIECIWGPSTAFYSTHPSHDTRGGEIAVGMLILELEEGNYAFEFADDPRMINHDIRNWAVPGQNSIWNILTEPSAIQVAEPPLDGIVTLTAK